MRLAVILTTYNQPEWLRKVLLGYSVQTRIDFDLLVADDGSGPETRDVVQYFASHGIPQIRHIWHEDNGFRKCEILNRAIVATDAEYIVFSDADCIPRRDFLDAHATLARRGRYLSGGMLRLNLSLSRQLTDSEIKNGRFAQLRWLRARGQAVGIGQRMRTTTKSTLARLFDWATPTQPTFNGHNSSAWRQDLLAVNGFDSTMGYGGLDRALGERLENYGVHGLQIRHRAPVFHLEHDRPYRRGDVIAQNRALRDDIRRNHEVRARVGIAELLK